ncbi:MAG TPA: M23 family metallopeptidase [Flavisolibacter sp.]|nr:M23 family metallopeptidase [Flavisolibacter sp.]
MAARNTTTAGNTSSRTTATPSVKFSWPLFDSKGTEFSYYGINNYVDLEADTVLRDPLGNYLSGLQDYNCGTRTYDGHNGLDIDLRPYSWKMTTDETVWVVAAADGIIVDGDDGNTDGNCELDSFTGPIWGNYLALMHDDSTISAYIHMKSGSVIPVTVGQRITRGQFLGVVASSGRSTGPHLHFGVYINNVFNGSGSVNTYGNLQEPFYGPCNTNLPSFWVSQKPYNEPSVIAIETHNNPPGLYTSNCDKTVNLYYDKTFSAGDIVYTRTWLRDWVDLTPVAVQLISPSGTVLSNNTRTNPNKRRDRNLDENFLLSASAPSGTYTVRVVFDGKVWERYFIVGCVQNYTVSGTLTGPKGYIAGNSIITTQVIESGSDNKVEYHSDGEIVFNVGFHAKAGSVVIADRKGCTGGYN